MNSTMQLRCLKEKDAPLMLEWMHDEYVVNYMKADFLSKTIEDCYVFIETAKQNDDNLHLAIVDGYDEYMGTVSLKNIKDQSAEFGIAVRKCAMGKGYAKYGMEEILRRGVKLYSLKNIYWCVDSANKRALRFYDKNGYHRCNAVPDLEGYNSEKKTNYIWYCVEGTTIYETIIT